MRVIASLPFQPDWASPPGHTISDILEERGINQEQFGERIGVTKDYASGLLDGRHPITREVAGLLSDALGASVDFWVTRERHYRELAAKQAAQKAEDGASWLQEIPYSDMAKFGWVPQARAINEKVANCLGFFGVPTISAWRQQYDGVLQAVAFRTSMTFEPMPGAVAAWLRQGTLEAEAIECAQWDQRGFAQALSDIRPLTRKKDPAQFIPQLQAICARYGVAVVIARAPSGCRASGATKFVSSSKALLLLSFRYLSDDHFWFTFFHEAGHLILHNDKALFLEGDGMDTTQEEAEANAFSASILVPEDKVPLIENVKLNAHEIIRMARVLGVSPGIVVGQLQHRGRLRRNQLNSLKRKFSWS